MTKTLLRRGIKTVNGLKNCFVGKQVGYWLTSDTEKIILKALKSNEKFRALPTASFEVQDGFSDFVDAEDNPTSNLSLTFLCLI